MGVSSGAQRWSTQITHGDLAGGEQQRGGCGWKITGEGEIVSERKRGSIRERERKRECAQVGKDGEQLEIWVKMVEKW